MSKKLIIANWKELPETAGEAEELVVRVDEYLRTIDHADRFDLIVCPSARYRAIAAPLGTLGAQDWEAGLAAAGARYAIIGHSDRRYKAGDDDATTNAKLKSALADGIVPIVCLGERAREGAWQDALTAQTVATLKGLTAGQVAQCLVAYEPVWAISTNPDAKPDTPASAVQSMNLIREAIVDHFDVSVPTFLYGGSVTPANAADFLSRPEISGVLVGGASVRAEDFMELLSIVVQL